MTHDESDEEHAIRALNERMHLEETRGVDGLAFYRDLLDPSLRFRRASGAVTTRDEYLIDLANPENRRDEIAPVGPIACEVYENTAFASVLLRVKGRNGDVPVAGLFRNLRIFRREASDRPWRLSMWFNDKVPG